MQSDRPFLGICLGLQLLFEGGEENGGVEGLGIIPGRVGEFTAAPGLPVPHIGWNTIQQRRPSKVLSSVTAEDRMYFVHSFRAVPEASNDDWVLATGFYGEDFVASVNKGRVYATQFHPEKSGQAGLQLLQNFVTADSLSEPEQVPATPDGAPLIQCCCHFFFPFMCAAQLMRSHPQR
jgi:imidazole glycerol-phosphate synthase